jgi:hypothetical protein
MRQLELFEDLNNLFYISSSEPYISTVCLNAPTYINMNFTNLEGFEFKDGSKITLEFKNGEFEVVKIENCIYRGNLQ